MLPQHCTLEIANINHLLHLQAFKNQTKSGKRINNSKQNQAKPNILDQKKLVKRRTNKWMEGQTDGQTDRDRTKQEYWLRKSAINCHNIPHTTRGGALQHRHELCRGGRMHQSIGCTERPLI